MTPARRQDGAFNGNYRGGVSSQPGRYAKAFKRANPEKVAAHRAVADAIRRGVLVRPTACVACLGNCRPDAHHADYSKPLNVTWLCRKCHCRENAPRKDRRHASQSGTAEACAPVKQLHTHRGDVQ